MKLPRHGLLGRILRMPVRAWIAFSYYRSRLRELIAWVFRSREVANFTYELADDNLDYLAHTIAVVTDTPWEEVRRVIDEARLDRELHDHVLRETASSPFAHHADMRCDFGRRLGWYAFVRILKPRVVVETGVDKGHGAVILCAALLRNEAEGFPGRYFGTDLNPEAGWLLKEPYRSVGKILYGDSIESLRAFDEEIDVFINDSDHSAEYERREYEVVLSKLAPGAVVLGDNAHVTRMLADFSRQHGRRFLFFKEAPKHHWYPGAGIGISFDQQVGRVRSSAVRQEIVEPGLGVEARGRESVRVASSPP